MTEGDIIKRYIVERALVSLKLTGMTYAVPFVLSLLVLGQENGYMLLFMIAGLAAICLSILMLPCIRFVAMIRSQEKKGLSFEQGETRLLSKAMAGTLTGTYLGTEWLIYAGSVALHHAQCKPSKE